MMCSNEQRVDCLAKALSHVCSRIMELNCPQEKPSDWSHKEWISFLEAPVGDRSFAEYNHLLTEGDLSRLQYVPEVILAASQKRPGYGDLLCRCLIYCSNHRHYLLHSNLLHSILDATLHCFQCWLTEFRFLQKEEAGHDLFGVVEGSGERDTFLSTLLEEFGDSEMRPLVPTILEWMVSTSRPVPVSCHVLDMAFHAVANSILPKAVYCCPEFSQLVLDAAVLRRLWKRSYFILRRTAPEKYMKAINAVLTSIGGEFKR